LKVRRYIILFPVRKRREEGGERREEGGRRKEGGGGRRNAEGDIRFPKNSGFRDQPRGDDGSPN
jgi:hypothetical protein